MQEDQNDKAIDDGFDYIERTAPLSTTGTAYFRWFAKSLQKDRVPPSPIAGWNEMLVNRAVDNLRKGGCLAKTRTTYPLTLTDVDPTVLRYVLQELLPLMRRKSLILIGEARFGKTPLAIILGFALARFWAMEAGASEAAQVRIAPDMDFFRGDPGKKWTPFIYDDGGGGLGPEPPAHASQPPF